MKEYLGFKYRIEGTEYLKVENIDYISEDAKFKGDV